MDYRKFEVTEKQVASVYPRTVQEREAKKKMQFATPG